LQQFPVAEISDKFCPRPGTSL